MLPAYLINLRSAAERRASMLAQTTAIGLPVEVFDAVDGRRLPADELSRLYSQADNRRRFYRPLTAGEIGCYASHLAVWRRVVERAQRCALVLEDDLVLHPSLPAALAALERDAMQWDIVKLVGRSRERALRRRSLGSGLELVRYRRVPSLTGAYVISADGARKLLGRLPPVSRPIDVDLRHSWEYGLRMRGLLPYPVALGAASEMSTIGRRPAAGLNARLRKWRYQLAYSWHNWQANLRGDGDDLD